MICHFRKLILENIYQTYTKLINFKGKPILFSGHLVNICCMSHAVFGTALLVQKSE